MECVNEVKLSGQIVKEYEIKHTIDNVPVLRFVLEHTSVGLTNEFQQNVKCRIYCLMLVPKNTKPESLINNNVTVLGFLNQNSKSQLILHVKQIDILNKGI
jgi:primosomal replication protein N